MNDEELEDDAPPERLPRDQRPSRSSKRRDALAVFGLAEALVAMTEAQLARQAADELAALVAESRITQHIARKRQLQFLAKHLRRNEDVLPPSAPCSTTTGTKNAPMPRSTASSTGATA